MLVTRSLPPLAKQYVLRLLFVEAAVSSKSIQDWALPDALNKHKVAIDKLEQLRVLIEATERFVMLSRCQQNESSSELIRLIYQLHRIH